MKNSGPYYSEIPIDYIHEDQDQPRESYGNEGDDSPLLTSIKSVGIGNAILVEKHDDKKYVIIDGHRRYRFAQKAGQKKVWCRVYTNITKGELALMRYHVQNIRRGWKPLERADALVQIKEGKRLKTVKELGDAVNLSESTVRQVMDLRNLKMEYLELMEKYGLPSSYRNEFVRLKPKLQKIKDIEVGQIIINIFNRVQQKVIKNSKEFRTLGMIFSRASANEQEIYRYLKNPQMTVVDLERRCSTSGFSLLIEKMLQQIAGKRSAGVPLSDPEEKGLEQLYKMLKHSYR